MGGFARIFVCCIGSFSISSGYFSKLSQVFIEGKSGENAIDNGGTNGHLEMSNIHIVRASDAIDKTFQLSLYLKAISCDPVTVTGSAVRVGSLSHIRQVGALPNFLGASATGNKAYYFTCDTAVKSNTWHAANFATVTDSKGAFITRED